MMNILNTIKQRELQFHIRVVGWLLIAEHALLLLAGVFLATLMIGAALTVGRLDQEAAVILPTVGFAVSALPVLFATPGLVAGVGLLAGKAWARILAIVVAMLGMTAFPVGTLIGIYTIWVLVQEAAAGYFTSPGECCEATAQPA